MSFVRPIVICIIFLPFLFGGCRKYSEYKKVPSGTIFINSSDVHVKSVEVVDWKIGPMFKQILSKGITIKLKLPMLKEEDVKDLIKTKKVNSWLIKISRAENIRSKILGYMYVPLIIPRRSATASLSVYYAAASLSARLENLHCPAFDHNKIITKLNVDPIKKNTKVEIVVGNYKQEVVEEKVEKFSLRPNVFNGGMSLEGEYIVELALYDFKGKIIRSSLVRFPEKIRVVSETTRYIKGCSNYKIPDKKDYKKKKIKFGW